MSNYFLQNYKICKYFLQNLLRKVFYKKYFAKKLTAIYCNFFFTTKIYKYFLRKTFQNKIGRKYNLFSSVKCEDLQK